MCLCMCTYAFTHIFCARMYVYEQMYMCIHMSAHLTQERTRCVRCFLRDLAACDHLLRDLGACNHFLRELAACNHFLRDLGVCN